MGDVTVIHTRHSDEIPVRVSRSCDEHVIVIPARRVDDRDPARAPVQVTFFAEDFAEEARMAKIRVE